MIDEIWPDVFLGLPMAVVAVTTEVALSVPTLEAVFVDKVVIDDGAGDAIRWLY